MKQHKLYTSISAIMLMCFTVAIYIFKSDWYWVPYFIAGGYLMRAVAELLDARAAKKKEIAEGNVAKTLTTYSDPERTKLKTVYQDEEEKLPWPNPIHIDEDNFSEFLHWSYGNVYLTFRDKKGKVLSQDEIKTKIYYLERLEGYSVTNSIYLETPDSSDEGGK